MAFTCLLQYSADSLRIDARARPTAAPRTRPHSFLYRHRTTASRRCLARIREYSRDRLPRRGVGALVRHGVVSAEDLKSRPRARQSGGSDLSKKKAEQSADQLPAVGSVPRDCDGPDARLATKKPTTRPAAAAIPTACHGQSRT